MSGAPSSSLALRLTAFALLVVFFQIRAQRQIMRNARQSDPGQPDTTGGPEATGADAGA